MSGSVGKTLLIKCVHHNIYKQECKRGRERGRWTDRPDHGCSKGPGSFMNYGIWCFILQHEQLIQGLGQTRTAFLDYSPAGKAGHRHHRCGGISDTCKVYQKKIHENSRLEWEFGGDISLLSRVCMCFFKNNKDGLKI